MKNIKMFIIALIIIFSLLGLFLIYYHRRQQHNAQIQFYRKGKNFWRIIGSISVAAGLFAGNYTEFIYTITGVSLGIFLLFFQKEKICFSYTGIYNGLFFVPWNEIQYYRFDRRIKGKVIYKTKKRILSRCFRRKFSCLIPSEYLNEIRRMMARNTLHSTKNS